MKDSSEPDLSIQKKFNFIPIPVIKKLINFQIRKKKIVNSEDGMGFCSTKYSRYLIAALRAVVHKDT